MPNWKKVIVSGSDAILNSITVTETASFLNDSVVIEGNATTILEVDGDISASGDLYIEGLENANGNPTNVVVYDTGSGQFYYTGSYGSGGGGADTDWKEFPTYLSSSKDIKITGSVYASSSLNAGTNIFAGEEGLNDAEGGIYFSNGVPLLFHGEDVTNPGPIRNYFAGASNISESIVQGTPLTLRSNNTFGAATDKNVAPHRVFVSGSLRLKPYGTQQGILELETLTPPSVSNNQPATTFQNIIAPESGSNFISGIARATGSIGNITTYGGGATSAFTSFGTSFVTADGLCQVAIANFPVARTKALRVNSVSMEVNNPNTGKAGLFIFPGFSWLPNNDTGWVSNYSLFLDEGLLLSNGISAISTECGYGADSAANLGNFTLLNGKYSVGSSTNLALFDSDGNLNFGNDGTYTYLPTLNGNASAGINSAPSPLSLVKNTTNGDLCLIFYTHEYYALVNQSQAAPWTFNPLGSDPLAATFTVNYESTNF